MERFIKLKEDMNAHALRDYPRECVGIITNDFTYIPCINTSPYPKDDFYIRSCSFSKNMMKIYGVFSLTPW